MAKHQFYLNYGKMLERGEVAEAVEKYLDDTRLGGPVASIQIVRCELV